MRYHCYAYKDLLINEFGVPIYDYSEVEFTKEAIQRDIILAAKKDDKNLIDKYRTHQLYYLGDFDTNELHILNQNPVLLVDCPSFLTGIIQKNENGNKEN